MFTQLNTGVLITKIQSTVYYIDYSIFMHIPIDGQLQGGLSFNLALSK